MARKITKLTEEQVLAFPRYTQEWTAYGLSTQPADRPRAEAAIRLMYEQARLPSPKIIWTGSPLGNVLARAILAKGASVGASVWESVRASVGESVGESVYGQHDANWLAFFRYFGDECGLKQETEPLTGLWELCQSAGWALPYRHLCFISERPRLLKRNAAARLHSDDGPALEYPDGFRLYCWHGYRLPPSHEWIIADRDRLSPEAIDAEPNAELRRIALEIYGFEKYLGQRKAKVVASDVNHGQPRRLLEANVGPERVRILEVDNGSLEPDGTRRKFHLGAMRGETPHECVAASYGRLAAKYREAVRT